MTWHCHQLLGEMHEAEFLERILGQHGLRITGDPGRFRVHLDWGVINSIIDKYDLSSSLMSVKIRGEVVSPSQYFDCDASDPDGDRAWNVLEITKALQDGACFSLSKVEERDSSVADLCNSWEDLMRVPVTADLCVSMNRASLGPAQTTDHDLISLQLYGTSEWDFFRPQDEPSAKVSVTVGEGDLLYVPAPRRVEMQSGPDAGARLTLTFRNPTGVDLLTRLFDQLAASDFVREFCPRFGKTEIQARYLTKLQAEIITACCEPGLMRAALADMRVLAPPRCRSHLHFPLMTEAADVREDAVLRHTIRFADEYTMLPLGSEQGFDLVHNGEHVILRGVPASVLKILIENNLLTASGVKHRLGLSDLEFRDGLQWLISKGLVEMPLPATYSFATARLALGT